MENTYKILDIIKELKRSHIGCYYDKICDVAERNYEPESSATENYLLCIHLRMSVLWLNASVIIVTPINAIIAWI